MARIELMQPGAPVPEFSVAGTVVTVAGVEVDCAAAQADSEVVVEVRDNNGVPEIGGGGFYLASIRIPARKYVEEATGETDPVTGEPVMARVAVPLGANEIKVTLWPVA